MLARLAELPLLVVLVGITGGLALFPALYAVGTDQTALGRDFLYSALIILICTVMLGIATAAFNPATWRAATWPPLSAPMSYCRR
jgi:trk system potassium uptake protein